METSRIVNESETEDEPSLDLSYSSSEFEYDEVDEFDDNSENPDDVAPQASYRGDIRPYDFEPYADQPDDDSTSEDSQDTEMENQERLRDAQLWYFFLMFYYIPLVTPTTPPPFQPHSEHFFSNLLWIHGGF